MGSEALIIWNIWREVTKECGKLKEKKKKLHLAVSGVMVFKVLLDLFGLGTESIARCSFFLGFTL